MQLDSLAVFCYLSFSFSSLRTPPSNVSCWSYGSFRFSVFHIIFNRIFHSVSNLSSKKVEDSKLCFASLFIKWFLTLCLYWNTSLYTSIALWLTVSFVSSTRDKVWLQVSRNLRLVAKMTTTIGCCFSSLELFFGKGCCHVWANFLSTEKATGAHFGGVFLFLVTLWCAISFRSTWENLFSLEWMVTDFPDLVDL